MGDWWKRASNVKRMATIVGILGLALLGPILLVSVQAVPSPNLKEDPARFWDIFLKAVGGVIGIGGAALAARKYLDEQAKANETAKLEARKPFDQQRQAIYLDLLSTTARIGNTRHKSRARKAASDHFWFIYWGPLPLVSDYRVGEAVNRFSELMDRPEDEILLRNASMEIANACRESLGYIGPEGIKPVSFAYPRLS